MNRNGKLYSCIRLIVLVAVLGPIVMFGGCGKKLPKVNPCSLAAIEQIQQVVPAASTATFEPPIKNNPAILCAWKDANGKVMAMLFVQQGSGGAPEQKLNAFFGKSARIVRVPGLGAEAAAAFSKNTKEGAEGLENIMADDKKWNVDFRALGVGDETTKEFAAAKDVVRTALDRLSSLK